MAEEGSVHNRLFRAALARQKAHRTLEDGDSENAKPYGRNRRSNSLHNSASNMPRGQYAMMID